ncbi:RNA helicase required for poly(A+) mRNA export [Sorochytrium milnesiophthora]
MADATAARPAAHDGSDAGTLYALVGALQSTGLAESSDNVTATSEPQTSEEPDDIDQFAATGLSENFNDTSIQVTLADAQADPNSPLYSVKRFEDLGLSPELLRGLYAMNYTKPSKIQERALPLLLREPYQNLIAQSQSGTGKTAAFTLTMLSRVDPNIKAPQALCLSNTRELTVQNADVAKRMSSQMKDVDVAVLVKDAIPRGTKITSQVVVGTPGLVFDMIRKRLFDTSQIKVLVLDEADNMLDMQSMGEQSRRVKQLVPPNVQVLLFSATFPDEVKRFASMFAPHANMITLRQEEIKVEAIKQFFVRINSPQEKFAKLSDIYGLLTVGQSIIFVARKETADDLARRMVAEGHAVSNIHGGLDPATRDVVMKDFREGRSKVLIATNVLARGIDIPQVNLVVNYDMPTLPGQQPDYESYVHRIGRTGRFGRQGVSINFIDSPRAQDMQNRITSQYGMDVVEMPSDFDVMEKMLKQMRVV